MCGIAGVFAFGENAPEIDISVVERLSEKQARRGPDGAGVWTNNDNRVAFAHRRLAIIDISADGAQPMTDATGRWTINFNGEIYKYAKRSGRQSRP